MVALNSCLAFAQQIFSDSSHVSFFSEALIENIEAHNYQGKSAFSPESKEIAFSIPITGFEFRKPLMKEHFNENYLESDKHPKSTFQGIVEGFDITVGGEQKVVANGTLELHGKSRKVSLPGKINFSKQKTIVEATFIVKLNDYNIKIPKLMFQNIAEEIEVKVFFSYGAYEKK